MWVGLLFFFSPVLLFLGYWALYGGNERKWEKGIFPRKLAYTRDNLLEAYICLAARMIQADTEDAGQKILYLNRHFNKYFPQENYDFSESIKYSYQHPIQVKTVSLWLKLNLPYDQRVQVLYFLMGLCFVDGGMNGGEYALLKEIVSLLEITPKDYQTVLGVYEQQYRRTEEPKKYTIESAVRLSCKILGVAESASMDEIRKAYRKMAKLHHPDRFATESTEQQQIAQERFLEIQKAYETLEKYR